MKMGKASPEMYQLVIVGGDSCEGQNTFRNNFQLQRWPYRTTSIVHLAPPPTSIDTFLRIRPKIGNSSSPKAF